MYSQKIFINYEGKNGGFLVETPGRLEQVVKMNLASAQGGLTSWAS